MKGYSGGSELLLVGGVCLLCYVNFGVNVLVSVL